MDHSLVEKRFLKARHTYEDHAQVQRHMAEDLIFKLKCLKEDLCILEIGCGTGFFSNLLLNLKPKHLVLNDLSSKLCSEAFERVKAKSPSLECKIQAGNMDLLNFNGSFDLICANAVLQWSVDLKALLEKFKAHLTKGGTLAFTTFLPGTLQELTQAGSPGLNYESKQSIMKLCQNLGFYVLIDEKEEVLTFQDAHCALKHLSLTGVSAIKRKHWTKGELKHLMHNLQLRSALAPKVLLTFKTMSVIATLQE